MKSYSSKISANYAIPVGLWLVFEAVAVVLWLALDNSFYLFNFSYIGTALAVGLALLNKKRPYARNIVQLAIGSYLLVYVGLLGRENMQIEGFWYYLFLGLFEAATIHYAVAKIGGPLVFGRGWCGYACWTAMLLDLLPFKAPQQPRKNWGWLRYLVFGGSLVFVGLLFVLKVDNLEQIIWRSFIIGNLIYYMLGITLAFTCRDNRAFCKYICPITVFLKPMSYFALLRIRVDESKCVACGKCERVCPMNVQVPSNARQKHNATECILCMRCVDECPQKALKF